MCLCPERHQKQIPSAFILFLHLFGGFNVDILFLQVVFMDSEDEQLVIL